MFKVSRQNSSYVRIDAEFRLYLQFCLSYIHRITNIAWKLHIQWTRDREKERVKCESTYARRRSGWTMYTLSLNWTNPLNVVKILKMFSFRNDVQTCLNNIHTCMTTFAMWVCGPVWMCPHKNVHFDMARYMIWLECHHDLSISFVKITSKILTDTDTNYFGVYLSFDH